MNLALGMPPSYFSFLRKLFYRIHRFTKYGPTLSEPLFVQGIADPVGLSAILARSPAACGLI